MKVVKDGAFQQRFDRNTQRAHYAHRPSFLGRRHVFSLSWRNTVPEVYTNPASAGGSGSVCGFIVWINRFVLQGELHALDIPVRDVYIDSSDPRLHRIRAHHHQ